MSRNPGLNLANMGEPFGSFGRFYIPAIDWSTVGYGSSGAGTRVYQGHGTGNFIQVVLTTLECRRFDATGQVISTQLFVPDDADVGTQMRARVIWASSETDAAQTATFVATFSNIGEDTAVADATTAISTAIGADTDSTTAYGLNYSGWGVINGVTLTKDRLMNLSLALNAVSGLVVTTDNIVFLGLQVEYTKLFIG